MARAYIALCSVFVLALFVAALYMAATTPFTSSEAEIWTQLVRPRLVDAIASPDAWRWLLYAQLAKRCIGVFRLSEWSFRVPALIAYVLYLWVLLRIARRQWLPAAVIVAIVPLALGWFSRSGWNGTALASCALSLMWPRGRTLFLGLAVAP